jgi:hypothetical protein
LCCALLKGKRFNSIYYDAYNLLGITYRTGEFEKIIYHNKALAVIDDDIIYPEFQSKATSYNNIGFLYLNMKVIFKRD